MEVDVKDIEEHSVMIQMIQFSKEKDHWERSLP